MCDKHRKSAAEKAAQRARTEANKARRKAKHPVGAGLRKYQRIVEKLNQANRDGLVTASDVAWHVRNWRYRHGLPPAKIKVDFVDGDSPDTFQPVVVADLKAPPLENRIQLP